MVKEPWPLSGYTIEPSREDADWHSYYFQEKREQCDKIGNKEYIDLRKVRMESLKEIRGQVIRLKKMGKTGKEIEKNAAICWKIRPV